MSNINLATLLQNLPYNWDSWPYTAKNYVTFEVEKDSAEYEEIEDELRNITLGLSVISIKRIQNPFAYGRFLLRKEQLQKRCINITVKRTFYALEESDIENAIDSNLDLRKISLGDVSVLMDKKCIIVDKKIEASGFNYNFFFNNTFNERDCNHYPEYILYLE